MERLKDGCMNEVYGDWVDRLLDRRMRGEKKTEGEIARHGGMSV